MEACKVKGFETGQHRKRSVEAWKHGSVCTVRREAFNEHEMPEKRGSAKRSKNLKTSKSARGSVSSKVARRSKSARVRECRSVGARMRACAHALKVDGADALMR